MIFTPNQIRDLLNIIDKNTMIFIAKNIGKSVLSDEDLRLLKGFGIDPSTIPATGIVDTSYKFGVLTQALGSEKIKGMTYGQFKSMLRTNNFIPLNARERFTVESIKRQSFADVKGLGDKIKGEVANLYDLSVSDVRNRYEDVMRDSAAKMVENRKSVKWMVSEIGHATDRWARDFDRIAEFISHTAFDEGRVAAIQKEHGDDAKIYKDVYGGACKHCIRLYLTAGIGSKPKVFLASELIANGTNIGRKSDELKPVIGSTHPYCFDKQTEVLTNEGWKFFKDIIGSEQILSVNLDKGDSEWVGIKNIVNYHYRGDLISYKSSNFDLLVTPDHRHVINTKKNKKWRLLPSIELPKGSSFLRTIPRYIGNSPSEIKIGNRSFNFNTFCQFMGFFLSEGSISKTHRGDWQIKISQSKNKFFTEIKNCVSKLFPTLWCGEEAIYIPLHRDNELIEYFKKFGKCNDKFVPEDIKNSNKESLLIFLEAFRMGDGNVKRGKFWKGYQFKDSITYYTCSNKLASDIGEILLKLGDSPSYNFIEPQYINHSNGRYKSKWGMWHISHNKNKTAILNAMKVTKIEYNDHVYDVELFKNHTLFVRRNGKVTLSGNCRCTSNHLEDGYEWNEEKKMFIPSDNWERKVNRKSKITVKVGDKETEI